ncbi:MAG: hypothetical protein KF767_09055 [Bdellovibrionaceae bacterium]|nr:hypothetical protein [Pseudobdellovibrionaceae bacterium]
MLKKFGALLLVMAGAWNARADVWPTENRWSEAYERRFAEFIRNLDLQIFEKTTGDWGRIPTDCADAAYALRIIFAYENRLPVSFRTWNGTMTNATSEFDGEKDPVKRVRRFMAKVNNSTNTRSLVNDTYPVAIRAGVLRPGVMFLHPQGDSETPLTYRAGHVYYLQNVRENGIIRFISSTVPAAIRSLDPRNGIIFTPMERDGGYRAWVWPDSSDRPNYSEEQFQIGEWRPRAYRDGSAWHRWARAVEQRIRSREPTPEEGIRANLENLTIVVQNRAKAVVTGWKFYQENYNPGQCMNERDYSSYSTPTRDVKVQVELQYFRNAAIRYVNSMGNDWGRDEASRMEQFNRKVEFEVLPGVKANVNDLNRAFLTETTLHISEPEHAPEVRWGLREQGRWPCPQRAKNYVGGERAGQN